MRPGSGSACMIAPYQERRTSFFLNTRLFSLLTDASGMGMIAICSNGLPAGQTSGEPRLTETVKLMPLHHSP